MSSPKRWATNLIFGLFLAMALAIVGSAVPPPVAQAAPGEVLILDTTHTKPAFGGQPNSLVEDAVIAAGKTPVVVNAVTWAAMTAAQFDAYDAIALGDPTCVVGTGPLAAAEANKAVWSSVIDGNMLLTGTDETFHSAYNGIPSQGGEQLAKSAMAFVVADAGKTGLYFSSSCYYDSTAAGTPVSVLSEFGVFTVTGVACHNDAHILVAHPALAGTTDATLSGWSCSVHEAFDNYPPTFLELAIAEDTGLPTPFPGSKSFPDGTTGVPYILVRGEGIEICGNGVDDDGDGLIDEGCPPPPVEICGDGVDNDGDGLIDEGCNVAPDCKGATADPGLIWPPNHKFVPVTILVTDADGDPVVVTVTSIHQDEPVKGKSSGNTSPDGKITAGKAEVRAERNGDPKTPGDGRVYVIGFDATDGTETCSGQVLVGVPHDQGQHNVPIPSSPLYDSTIP